MSMSLFVSYIEHKINLSVLTLFQGKQCNWHYSQHKELDSARVEEDNRFLENSDMVPQT